MFLILFCVLLLTFIYLKIIKPFDYWSSRGVKQRNQVYVLGDTFSMVIGRDTFWDATLKMYNAFPEERYMGLYQMVMPKLLIRDPDLIKQLTVKDFDHFVDRQNIIPEGADPLWNRNLISLTGDRWREMRSILSPSFTASKMRIIFNLVRDCAEQFCSHFLKKEQEVIEVELKDIFTRYTNDVIASVAFGIHCDSLEHPENEFYLMGKSATIFTGFWTLMKFMAFVVAPQLCKTLGLKVFDENVRQFFTNLIKDTIKTREEKGITRPDMLQLLIEARKNKSEENSVSKITDTDITAQALIFFLGGFESVSSAMCFLAYELTINPIVQQKLHEEIDRTSKEWQGNLTYEVLTKLKYLDMVISETLRKWPPNVIADRKCVKPYTIQPERPGERPLHLQEGDIVWFTINALHHDPKYFPNPEVFDPERFSDENKETINPYAYIPFGTGPRNCIGSRFALLELKALFFHLLSNFELVKIEKTQVPLKLKKNSVALLPEHGFWVGLKRRLDTTI